MSLAVTSGIPSRLTIGDAASFTYSSSLYAAPDWSAQLVVRDSEGNVKTFDATDDGANHLFALSNADTATLKTGLASVTVVLSDGTNRQSSFPQNIWIDPDPTTAATPTKAQEIVDELEGAILKLAKGTSSSVSFNGQSFTKRDLESMNRTLTWWKARVIRENQAAQITDRCGYRPAKCGGKVPWA